MVALPTEEDRPVVPQLEHPATLLLMPPQVLPEEIRPIIMAVVGILLEPEQWLPPTLDLPLITIMAGETLQLPQLLPVVVHGAIQEVAPHHAAASGIIPTPVALVKVHGAILAVAGVVLVALADSQVVADSVAAVAVIRLAAVAVMVEDKI